MQNELTTGRDLADRSPAEVQAEVACVLDELERFAPQAVKLFNNAERVEKAINLVGADLTDDQFDELMEQTGIGRMAELMTLIEDAVPCL